MAASFPAVAGVTAGASTAVILYLQAKTYATPPLQPTIAPPSELGWHGDPVERPAVRQPVFEDSADGRQAFVVFLRQALENIGLTHDQALLFIAHKARETGWGKAIWDYNFGNIKIGGNPPRGPWFWLTDRLGFRDKYRAYDTAEDGIWDNVSLIKDSSRYKKSWSMLIAGDPNWYGQLGLDGYYEGPPDPSRPGHHTNNTPDTIVPVQQEYNSILDSVRRYDQAQPETAQKSSAQQDVTPGVPQLEPSDIWRITWISALVALGTYLVLEAPRALSPQPA
jgi:hypothetical protein